MTGVQIGVLAFLALSAIVQIAMVGKPRPAPTAGTTAVAVAILMLLALLTVLFGGNS